MELIIRYTNYWDGARRNATQDGALDFCYEVQASPDWLVGGHRKGHYAAREGEDKSFSLLLWPQRTGRLLLPSVEIHAIAVAQDTVDGDGPEEPAIVCEMDYKDQSRAIHVVSDLSRTTVNLDPSGGGGGWLIEAQSRNS